MASDFKIKTKITGKDAATKPIRSLARAIRGDLRRSFKRAGKAARGLGRGIKKLGVIGGAGLVAAGVGVTSLIGNIADGGDELAKLSKRAGITAQEFAELRFAAEKGGVAHQEFNDAMRTFTRNMGELKAKRGPLVEFLRKGSRGFMKLLRNTDSASDALNLMLQALADVEDPAAKAALASIAFGESGAKLTTVVEGGTEALEEQRQIFRKYVKISPEYLAASVKFKDAQTEAKTAIEGVKVSIAQKLLPALTPLLKDFSDWLSKSENVSEVSQAIATTLADIAKWIRDVNWKEVASGVADVFKIVGQVFDKLWEWKEVIGIIAGTLVLGKVIASVVRAKKAVTDLAGAFLKTKTAAAGAAAASQGVGGGAVGGGRAGAVARGAGLLLPVIAGAQIAESGIREAVGREAGDVLFGADLDRLKTEAQEIQSFFDRAGLALDKSLSEEALTESIGLQLGRIAGGMTAEQAAEAKTPMEEQTEFFAKALANAFGPQMADQSVFASGLFASQAQQQQQQRDARMLAAVEKIAEPKKDELKVSLSVDVTSDPGTKATIPSTPSVSGKPGKTRTSLGSASIRSGSSV